MPKPMMTFDQFMREHALYEGWRFKRFEGLIALGMDYDDAVREVFPDRPEYLTEKEHNDPR